MTLSLTPLDSLLVTFILATLTFGLPILVVLSIRFLWDRNLKLGRSRELEKLIWQLHRMASAMEHQMNLSFPAVQPGTEEPSDLAYLQQIAAQTKAATQSTATTSTAAAATEEQATKQPVTSEQAAQQAPFPPLVPREPSAEAPRHGGVNSMFGF